MRLQPQSIAEGGGAGGGGDGAGGDDGKGGDGGGKNEMATPEDAVFELNEFWTAAWHDVSPRGHDNATCTRVITVALMVESGH